ncbi:MAG: LptF/LptG family permease [Spirochaetaceae bacterium]|jgi:lipopolysaccharide export system permease protein|nr:LptF/LptG family permease [Spirochaetaceae bacterium]
MIFTRYLFRKFIPIFIGAVIFCSLVLVLIDLMMNLWRYMLDEVPFEQVATVMILYMPKTIFFAVPLSILFAACYALSDLYAHNELIAVHASGVSLFNFTSGLLLFSFLFSFALFVFEDRLVVPTYAKKVELQDTLLGKTQSLDASRIVVISRGGNIVYKADRYSNEEQRLEKLYLVVRNSDKSLMAILRADYADWDGEKWRLVAPIQYTSKNDSLVMEGGADQGILAELTEAPETFRNNTLSVEEVNVAQAKVYISKLQRSGLPVAEAQSQYYKKFAFPFVVFIVVFLSIGLSGKTRKNVMIVSFMLCLFSAVAFYIMQMVTMLLAQNGMIPPIAGAWFPVIFFTMLSLGLLKYVKT